MGFPLVRSSDLMFWQQRLPFQGAYPRQGFFQKDPKKGTGFYWGSISCTHRIAAKLSLHFFKVLMNTESCWCLCRTQDINRKPTNGITCCGVPSPHQSSWGQPLHAKCHQHLLRPDWQVITFQEKYSLNNRFGW